MREDERNAFAKACRYLYYSAAATRLSQVAAVGTAICLVGLLFVLWLFADLMVNRGQLPSFNDLPSYSQDKFLAQWQNLPAETALDLLPQIGVKDQVETLASKDAARLTPREHILVWRAYLVYLLRQGVGPQAAERVTVPYDQPLPDLGILSLVVRSHVNEHISEPVVSWLARWNPWMWKYRWANLNYPCFLSGLLVLALGLAVLRACSSFLMHQMAARASIEAVTRLRRAVYHHTFRLGTLALQALGPSEAVSIFTRHVEALHEALYARLTGSFVEPVKFTLLLIFALVVQPWLALAFLLFAVMVWLVGGRLAAHFRHQGRVASNRAAEQLTLIRESLMLMRLVKIYLMELFNQARVERLLARYARAQLLRLRGEAISRPLLVLMASLAGLILLYVAGLIVLRGQLGAASTVALATSLVCLYWPVENWLKQRRLIGRGQKSAQILFQFLARPGEVGQVVGAEFLPPLSQRVEFDDVSLREPGSTRMLLQGVTLTIPAGQRIGLIGPDDLEKRALVYLIPRLLDPTSGEIRIDQHNLRWVTLDSLRNQIGLVLQDNLVFHDTVANNIGCGDLALTLPKIIEAAKMAHAHHFIQKLPQGYDTPIGELGYPLNASQKFRIALARAIQRDPALVIIEEPVESLDEDSKALLDDTFSRFLPGRTVLFLPHRISTIRACDLIFLLHKGRIEAEGLHRDLLTQNSLYRHFHYLEFAEIGEQM